ncbi:aromatic ring-hydroxylating dioxygenase subunit alpha [Paraburkholderia sp. J63]|uniref:aromatic ring-hydroxylating dioxygenase subunit alpha n=1 Tax=Paraburkholderia sp. J63 TaxID=2805434 RepID=UPI002ABDA949|nr:aromatic ring-hydroxylating dioxygenase subunit alpha [Paraburkholderia sp. J63]
MFVKNAWYVAALSHEVGRSLLPRRLLGEAVVLYRKEDGAPAAIEDRCSHRFYPLSNGMLKGDTVICEYHGLEFDCEGQCLRIPGQDTVPRGAHIRGFTVREKWQFVWIWMGDPQLADESLIPNLWMHEAPGWATSVAGRVTVNGDYRLLADNLLDSSHVAYLHRTTLASDVSDVPVEYDFGEWQVRATRWTIDRPPAPMFAQMRDFPGNVDRWQITTFTAPSFIEVDLGSCATGTGARQGDRREGVEMRAINLATPADADSFHYFYSHNRNFRLDDTQLTAMTCAFIDTAISEDVRAIEGVHAGFRRYPGLSPLHIKLDGAGLRARRIIDDLLQAEAR